MRKAPMRVAESQFWESPQCVKEVWWHVAVAV
jgi:hypothetical protein